MLANPRYHGLDLPVYPPETEIVVPSQRKRAFDCQPRANDQVWFVRPVSLDAPFYPTLLDCLKDTDKELNRVAELCNAETVDHEWGFIDEQNVIKDNWKTRNSLRLLPEGYLLVAKVAVIDPDFKQPPRYELESLYQGLSKYLDNRQPNKPYLNDICLRQFMYGLNKARISQQRLWLLDIEPLFGYHP